MVKEPGHFELKFYFLKRYLHFFSIEEVAIFLESKLETFLPISSNPLLITVLFEEILRCFSQRYGASIENKVAEK